MKKPRHIPKTKAVTIEKINFFMGILKTTASQYFLRACNGKVEIVQNSTVVLFLSKCL
jgi:hypothetical protein